MRIIGVFPRDDQVGAVVDSLKNAGFDRKDMIISDIGKTPKRHSTMDDVYIKTESESLQELPSLSNTLDNKSYMKIIVSVELPQGDSSRVIEIMEQSGAIKIYQD